MERIGHLIKLLIFIPFRDMHGRSDFITTHIILAKSGGNVYKFPQTLRDVYAFRVRGIHTSHDLGDLARVVHVVCPQLVSGYRWGSQNGKILYTVAQFPCAGGLLVANTHKQHKHYLSSDVELSKVEFQFANEEGSSIPFDEEYGTFIIVDFWQRNKHVY